MKSLVEGQEVASGTATSTVYSVEARVAVKGNQPIVREGMKIDYEWRKIHFEKNSRFGIPNHVDEKARDYGFLSYNTAMALAYWLMTELEYQDICVRLVEHEIIITHKITRGKSLKPFGSNDNFKMMIKSLRGKPT
jgi:hypothetical protein